MCWEGKARAEGVRRGGGNQIQLEGGLYLDNSKEPQPVLILVSVLDFSAVMFFFLTIQHYYIHFYMWD